MKGENLTSVITDKMPGHVTDCVDIFEDFKENSIPINKINGHDVPVKMECDNVSDLVKVIENSDQINQPDLLNRTEKHSIECTDMNHPNSSKCEINSSTNEEVNLCFVKKSDSSNSVLNSAETQVTSNRNYIQDKSDIRQLSNSYFSKPVSLDITSLKLEKVRMVLNTVLKAPLRDMLKSKIEAPAKRTTENETVIQESVVNTNQEKPQHWDRYKITPKRVRFLAENCFKVCDKNEIKTLLSPLMKTSLSEILRSNVNSQTVNDQNILNSDESTIDLSCSDYQKILSDGESLNEIDKHSCHSVNCSETQSAIDDKRITDIPIIEIKQENNINERIDACQRFLSSFTNKYNSSNEMGHKSSREKLRNAMTPILKMSISDVIRRKLSKSGIILMNDNSDEVNEKMQKSSNCSKLLSNSSSSYKKFTTHGRITRSKLHTLCEGGRKLQTDNLFKLVKKKNKISQKSLMKRIPEDQLPNLVSQFTDPFVMPDQRQNIPRKRRRRRYFKGGKYNLTVRRRRKKATKIIHDDEEMNVNHSEEQNLVKEKWPSDISVYDNYSSFSSEYSSFNCGEELNKKFKNNQLVFTQMDKLNSTKPNTKENSQMNSEISLSYIKNSQEFAQNINSKSIQLDKKLNSNSRIVNRKKIYNMHVNKKKLYADNVESDNMHEMSDHNSLDILDSASISYTNKNIERSLIDNEEISNYINLSDIDQNETENSLIKNYSRIYKEINASNKISNSKHLLFIERKNSRQEEIEHAYTKPISNEEYLKLSKSIERNHFEDIRDISNNDRKIKNFYAINSNLETNSFKISECSSNINFEKKDGKLTPEKAGDRLRELITEKQAAGDDGVFVTITVNAEGIVEDIEKIEPSAFVDIGSMSTFVPIEESSEEIVINSSMPVLDCVPINNNDTDIQSSEVTVIPEPCYTLEIQNDELSTVETEQFPESEKVIEESSSTIDFQNKINEIKRNNNKSKSLASKELAISRSTELANFMEINGENSTNSLSRKKENVSSINTNEINNDMVCNVKYRHRSKRKLPEDHIDVDCISITSSSSTETEKKSNHKKLKVCPSLTEVKCPSPPKLKLQTCSVYDHTQKGGPCHKTLHTNLVGLRLIKKLLTSEQNLLKERTGINIDHPGLTVCQHHKKIFIDKYEDTLKTDASFSSSICTCYNKPIECEKKETDSHAIYCQAKDSIDEKVIGCSNIVSNHVLVRPSTIIPYMMLCEVHMWRLHHHQCCPCCGIFCTQGTFSQCILQRKTRCQIHLFHCHCISSVNGLSEKCPHCGAKSNFRKIKLELNIHRSPSKLKEKSLVKSGMKYLSSNEEEKNENICKLDNSDESSENISPSESLSLNKLQQQSLLSLMSGEKMNMRFTIKSFYGPIKTGDIDKFLQMLAIGFNPNHRFEDHENETPLHIAASLGHLAFVQILVQAGASVDHMNNELFTPLMLAVENNHLSIVLYLLAAGAQLDARSEDGMTCLHLAAQNGHSEICSVLLNTRRIDINVQVRSFQ
ncbi:putative leucine-rich repeat-containing protein DDB_G0290503 isoform X1 [Centruroides sculpturatus]|uniref:putative leucine-rich repeat-containing protein DDB_G0290503 isoform X1 n=1 Tax=Centruroides sculpturatus TaxID=218467 RepID=UPI000C6EE4F6|nr:putative leucine-rich repeat-containing protein DDB_G0290503 isoform X1 [Centruroides sculpturatus]XP_023233901.1 putative leucine-rich repeat-containing protein DDB_G0290503 isoform X1 [Centruroides sculpturatus]XP_023233907.1 putative leucine-rich repeat-containing protein DDB_G0290503 isoform X1 [Centruroides sculpturatus]XP_023233913.1 putative leucine-rich repeat-containing protein DDB_G0290503 isoform X1 [Centruroides sculpturatus]XP_023233921.1 putative leucine-rich repeat-containing 